jgi:hypothetical protein
VFEDGAMVTVELTVDTLTVHIQGIDKILALESRLELPLEHVAGVEAGPVLAREWWKRFRLGAAAVNGALQGRGGR